MENRKKPSNAGNIKRKCCGPARPTENDRSKVLQLSRKSISGKKDRYGGGSFRTANPPKLRRGGVEGTAFPRAFSSAWTGAEGGWAGKKNSREKKIALR